MSEPSSRPFTIAMIGFGLFIAVAVSLLVFNLVNHALHKISTLPTTTTVLSVVPDGPQAVTITAQVTSEASTQGQAICLVGVELPSTPLAYPIQVPVELAPGQTRTVGVHRTLLKPWADRVTVADVAFKCT